MNLLKGILAKKEDKDVPEMVLQKNEKKSWYDPKLKVWMFEGEEDDIKKNLEKQNKPPPKPSGDIVKPKDNSETEERPILQAYGGAKKQIKKQPVAKYPNAAHEITKEEQKGDSEDTKERRIFTPAPNQYREEKPIEESNNMEKTLFVIIIANYLVFSQ
jgi:hypothetical protein